MIERSGKRPSSVASEKMERVGDREGQMERYCSTGQSPQRAVAPTEEEFSYKIKFPLYFSIIFYFPVLQSAYRLP